MNSRVEHVMSWVVIVATVVLTGAVVRREFLSTAASDPLGRGTALSYDPGWRGLLQHGILMGNFSAPIKIVEFGDLECPACRGFHQETLSEITRVYGPRVSLTFLHFPLRNHRFAYPAAKAAECAHEHGRFMGFVDAIFDAQDSLGLRRWTDYAIAAGISDTSRFASCVASTRSFTRIDSGLALARRMELHGTPTILVNGWRFPRPPRYVVLSRVIDELIAGRSPEEAYKNALAN